MTGKQKIISDKLMQIHPLVNKQLVYKAALFMGCSDDTVRRYLTGLVAKETFGEKLLKYFETQLNKQNTTV